MKLKINKNIFLYTLAGISAVFLASFLTFVYPDINNIVVLVLSILFFVISLKSLEVGMMWVITELLVGVQGYVLSFDFGSFSLSLRIIFFIIWLALFLVQVLFRQRQEFGFFLKKNWQLLVIPLALIVYGVARALFVENDLFAIFFDGNGYVFWLYLVPFLYIGMSQTKLLSVICAGIAWIIGESIALLYIFGHQFETVSWWLYHWLRDYRMAEITPITVIIYRIFTQNQIFLLLAFSLLFVFLVTKVQQKKYYYETMFVLIITGLVISYSRSMWLGAVAIGFSLLIAMLSKKIRNIIKPNWLIFIILPIISIAVSFGLWWGVANIPIPSVEGNKAISLSNRFKTDEPAANARLKMLGPLLDEIKENPIFGFGFGKQVTYFTTDPRIVASTAGASGKYTTFAFEWGYLDIALKFGLLGLVIYMVFLIKFIISILKLAIKENSVFYFGLVLALIGLLAVNITTPYLNHPLGIGFIILVLLFSNIYGRAKIPQTQD